MISGNPLLMIAAFFVVTSLLLLVAMLLFGRERGVESRLKEIAGPDEPFAAQSSVDSTLPRAGTALMPDDESKISHLRSRLRQAGLYRRHSTTVYLGVKFVCMVAPMLIGMVLAAVQFLSFPQGILFGAAVGLVGTLAPGVWLRRNKIQRQRNIRRALPDALDVIVICLEGGLSLPASFARVATELRDAHPMLADEMAIVQREIDLGRSTGEALRQFADRFDAEELRGLSAVIIQAERFGASIVKALRVHADSLRMKRYHYAEEQAQKAPVKLIFPTVLCIFPALYLIMMGPAGVQLFQMLDKLGK